MCLTFVFLNRTSTVLFQKVAYIFHFQIRINFISEYANLLNIFSAKLYLITVLVLSKEKVTQQTETQDQ